MPTSQAQVSGGVLQQAPVDHETSAFYEIITPRLADLCAGLPVNDGTSADGDTAPSPDLQWGQWANWASWTKML
jgi:hypothetical protein